MRAALVGCVVVVMSAGQSQAQLKPIDEMRIEKVGLGTSRHEFLDLHPKAQRALSEDDKYGVKNYMVVDDDGGNFSTFCFLDDKLYMMYAHWTGTGLYKAGGWEPIVDRVVKKYGKADADSPGKQGKRSVLRWVSPATANNMIVMLNDGELTISLSSKKYSTQLNELKAKQARRRIDD